MPEARRTEPGRDSGAARRPRSRPLVVVVDSVERLTPKMVRIVFGGDDLGGFEAGEFSDHYVKLQLPAPGAEYAAPFDAEAIKAELPRELWPRTRTYTVSAWDPARRLLTVDFVVHGDEGVAGPWAASARVGDFLQLAGPGGAYTPDPDADWHLMVGDPSVIPAIAASLPRVPAGKPVHVVLQVEGPDDEVALDSPGDLRLTWLHGGGDDALVEALRGLELRGRGHAFVHGEASAVRTVRRHLVVERAVAAESLSCSGYWKRTRTEEGWRDDKAEWVRLVESDASAA